MPEEVRGEIGPYFVDCAPVVDEDNRKLPKLDDTAGFIRSGLSVCQLSFIPNYYHWFIFLNISDNL